MSRSHSATGPRRWFGNLLVPFSWRPGSLWALRIGVGAAALGALGLPAGAGPSQTPGLYSFASPEFFAGGVTAESSWEEILKGTVLAQMPMLNFGPSFVPLSAVCAEGDSLRVAASGSDGLRIPSTQLPQEGRARAAMSGSTAARADQLAAANIGVVDQLRPGKAPDAPIRYLVSVYRVITNVGLGSPWWVHLFDKAWEVPACRRGTN